MKKLIGITLLSIFLAASTTWAETYDLATFLKLVEQHSKDLKLAAREPGAAVDGLSLMAG